MHKETGKMQKYEELTEADKESNQWVEVRPSMSADLMAMDERRRVSMYNSAQGRSVYFNATIKPTPSAKKRRDKRKSQRIARKKNR
jgi:hypothetical protein